ncbi:glycosyltransferase family 2 protein [Paracoccus benzoatiresistens]|uniref:Glycosyltransferase family 2 protein n=1 Tax=Paracoccus benzoatiresistens TaxID=2997341 RepID=A0ABT4J097_9RHOB|nr:glycosyltransferase family 2 protein [Paracoccus sp. EF6]MCZ0960532.1 glycosyltransferase family 2 protein [Paracoccus sp. EF6]
MDRPTSSARDDTVTILLASHQGAAFIGAQLQSIADQTHGNWRLIVSDDGSKDGTRDIVAGFAASRPAGQVQLIDGPRRGATQNFLHLLSVAPDGIIAFCDQDDVWFPDKLARACRALAPHDGPVHYAARTIITDDGLTPVAESRHFPRPLGFRNALVQAIMAGNTSVFNAEAAAILRCCVGPAQDHDVQSHDWWAYQVTAGAGAVLLHDKRPALFYRQHGRSEMGRNDTVRAMSQRIAMLLAGNYGGWLAANHAALDAVRSELLPENRRILDSFGAALHQAGPVAALTLARIGLYRQTRAGTAAFYGAALMGRLRQCGPRRLMR